MDTIILMLIGSNLALIVYLCHKDMKGKRSKSRRKATA